MTARVGRFIADLDRNQAEKFNMESTADFGFDAYFSISYTFTDICRRGGIGRRAGLKIQWPRGRVGSSPSAGKVFIER